MEKSNIGTEYKGFPLFLIWYYRLIGITFGGIQVKRSQIVSNKWLRYYSYLATLSFSLLGVFYIHSRMTQQDHLKIYEGFKFTYYLMGVLIALDIIQIVVNQWFLNKNGIQMIKTIAEYGLGTKAKIFILCLFGIPIFLRLIALSYTLYYESIGCLELIGLIADKLLLKPGIESFMFICLSFSLSIYQYYRTLGLSLNVITYEAIATIRQSFAETRKLIIQFDQSMTLCQIVTISHSMFTLMFEVYILAESEKIKPPFSMKTYYMTNAIGCAYRLVLICLVNGLVYDQTDQLLIALEDIQYSKDSSDGKAFKELLTFRTLNWNIPNGFTIGGLMPLKRTTLLSIFGFILTYAVILVQTGAK